MAFLKILTGEQKGKRFEIDRDEVIIGRLPENAVPVPAKAVSSRHCAVIRDGRKFTIKDLDSTNGTRLNGVTIQEYQLSPKDIITIGDVDIQLDGDDIEGITSTPAAAPAIGPQMTVRLSTSANATSLAGAPAFQARRDGRMAWIVGISILVILVLGALGFFLVRIFQS